MESLDYQKKQLNEVIHTLSKSIVNYHTIRRCSPRCELSMFFVNDTNRLDRSIQPRSYVFYEAGRIDYGEVSDTIRIAITMNCG